MRIYQNSKQNNENFIPGAGKVYCEYKTELGIDHHHKACVVSDQQVDSKDVVVASPSYDFITWVTLSGENVVEIPKNFGEKFPKLEIFVAFGSSIAIVRNFTFANMNNLLELRLNSNKITTIESHAFDGLSNVRKLNLGHNLIEVLVENIFASMVNLEELYLNDNKIRILSPSLFEIPGGRLYKVRLHSNVCISSDYDKNTVKFGEDINDEDLAGDIKNKCWTSEN